MLSDNFLNDKLFADRSELWNRRLGSPTDNQYAIIAQHDEDVVGFACAFGGENPQWGSLLDNLHVQPTQRGRGIGKTLMASIANWCCLEYLFLLHMRKFLMRISGIPSFREFDEISGALSPSFPFVANHCEMAFCVHSLTARAFTRGLPERRSELRGR
jgi:GNAT superfamily N-acetyltransferase